MGRLPLGLCLATWEDQHGRGNSWPEMRERALLAEQAGVDSLWVPDHFLYRPDWGFRDGWTILPAVAAVSSRVMRGGPLGGGPPIGIGASGPRMLRLAARWADVFNYQAPLLDAGQLAEPFARLDEACREVGRDPATLVRTGYCLISFAGPDASTGGYRAAAIAGTDEEIAGCLYALGAAGLEHLVCVVDSGEERGPLASFSRLTRRGLERFVRVLEVLRKLEAGVRGGGAR